ncbi:MAG: carboxypeptidase regulatory-like domain-containing protein [Thermoplasmatota archaeon]
MRWKTAAILTAAFMLVSIVPLIALTPVGAEPTTAFYGYVTDYSTGDPIENCGIMVLYHSIGRIVYTNEEGYYRYVVDKGGEYSFVAKMEGYYDEYKEEFIVLGEEKQVDFLMIPYKSSVSGYVTDSETGEPIADAFVEFRNENIWSNSHTDEDGYYTIGIEPGTFEVFIDAQDYRTFEEGGYVIYEGDQNEHDFELEKFTQGVFGYVSDKDGNPIEGANLKFQGPGSAAWCSTDENGYYEINLLQGKYKVSVFASGYANTKGNTDVEFNEMTEENWVLYEQTSMSFIMRFVKLIMDLLGF